MVAAEGQRQLAPGSGSENVPAEVLRDAGDLGPLGGLALRRGQAVQSEIVGHGQVARVDKGEAGKSQRLEDAGVAQGSGAHIHAELGHAEVERHADHVHGSGAADHGRASCQSRVTDA
jgi:hypothetical protein